ncbi:MAG: cell envelope integrity protein TolA [Gallionellaceae bacterium]|jgi:colicin import membrane protein
MNASVTREPYKISAGALALLVHAGFFSLLYFSFSWQMKPPQGMVVDIWDSLPSDTEQEVVLPPPPPPAQKPEQVVTPKVETPPVAPANADIDIRDKKKKIHEEKLKLEAAKAKLQAEKQADLAERRLDELERQAQAKSQAQHKAQELAAIETGKVVDEYIGRIAARIRRFIVLPPGVSKSIRAEFNVTLLPSGEVLSANLAKSSGVEAYDSAVERAILKAQPLPLPPAEQNMFNKFRELRLKFSPAESRL